uniref:SXP/RAL-2 family protein Ani s 5-like cation-binding domain-containing protein n=1 Tax=Acrobeloides nanus TaxID=290746 RepID=A0A914DTC2_9BILA
MYKILILSAAICIAYLPSILSIPKSIPNMSNCYGCSFINNLELDKLANRKLRTILRDKSLTKREIDDQIEDIIRTQSPSTNEKFRTMKDQDEQKEIELQRKIQLVAEKLSPEARAALQQMQAASSNKDLTVAESVTKFQEIRKALSPEIQTELAGGLKEILSTQRVAYLVGNGRGISGHGEQTSGNSGRGEQTRGNSGRREQTRGNWDPYARIIHLI